MPIGLVDQGVFAISPLWLAADLFCVRDGRSPLHPLKPPGFVSIFSILYTFTVTSLFISLLERLNCLFHHFKLSFRVLRHITPSSLLFDFIQLLSPFSCAFPCVSFNLLFFPPPLSTPRSASCGLNVAPAHTSARHEAVRVWLESVSGGSADLKGIAASYLRLSQLGLFLQHAHACSLHGCCSPGVHGNTLGSSFNFLSHVQSESVAVALLG